MQHNVEDIVKSCLTFSDTECANEFPLSRLRVNAVIHRLLIRDN